MKDLSARVEALEKELSELRVYCKFEQFKQFIERQTESPKASGPGTSNLGYAGDPPNTGFSGYMTEPQNAEPDCTCKIGVIGKYACPIHRECQENEREHEFVDSLWVPGVQYCKKPHCSVQRMKPSPTKESKTLEEKYRDVHDDRPVLMAQIATDHFKARFEEFVEDLDPINVGIYNRMRHKLFNEGK